MTTEWKERQEKTDKAFSIFVILVIIGYIIMLFIGFGVLKAKDELDGPINNNQQHKLRFYEVNKDGIKVTSE